jgi:hypothetical protein
MKRARRLASHVVDHHDHRHVWLAPTFVNQLISFLRIYFALGPFGPSEKYPKSKT